MPQNANQQIPVDPLESDPLLQCLVFFTKHYGRPFSAKTLSMGLPLHHGRLVLKDIPRAAQRGGLAAKFSEKSFDQLQDDFLPCVLLLEQGKACILLSRNQEQGTVTVSWPEVEDSEEELAADALAQRYVGHALLVKKKHRFDKRAPKVFHTLDGHWFWDTIKLSAPIYRDALLAAFFINLFAIAIPLYVMNVYDRVVPNLAVDTLWVLTSGMVVIFVFDFILKQLRGYLLDVAAKKSDVLLSSRLFEKMLNLKAKSRPESLGAFARNVQEFDSIRDFVASSTMAALIDLPFALLFFAVLYFIAGPAALLLLIAILAMLAFSFWVLKRMATLVEQGSRLNSQKQAHLVESLAGLDSLKLAGAESQFQGKWESLVSESASWSMQTKKYTVAVASVTSFIQHLVTVAIVVSGVYLIMDNQLSFGGLIAFVLLGNRMVAPFAQIALLATRYQNAKAALTNLEQLMALEEEQTDHFLHRGYFDGKVEFDRVGFSYPGTQHQVLKDVSFTIRPGEKVAIIGRIGSGKTTIEKLMLQFYQPGAGAIRFDGVDSQQINPADLRQKIGCVPQDINLFYGSVRDNITLGVPHVDDERVLKAARLAGVTQFTDHEPNGLDRQVGERGSYLSGGQRQSVAMARALLFNPPILVLDEPSSHMDSHTEFQLIRHISQVAKDKTLILITHKMSMLELVDRVIVLEKGRVVADGSKAAVLAALKQGRSNAE
ncbi:type I secretion system permease/ATPase [Alkalimonas delamerensis]|uniref:Type I secretion system permease/ATPase n=1 Tax=Alkalimonas delamerensis TaxID=265981 RepID=A0ABT9GST3_9GAMM|nr:type I secretion system permease/ATPase [Alkalimonas delamerensis]MDP4529691.1 type I secretion system permease/ATPase [Alkalimonas delamerensis]